MKWEHMASELGVDLYVFYLYLSRYIQQIRQDLSDNYINLCEYIYICSVGFILHALVIYDNQLSVMPIAFKLEPILSLVASI